MLQILLSENPESNILPSESRRAIIQQAGVCYDREVEKDKTNSSVLRWGLCKRRKRSNGWWLYTLACVVRALQSFSLKKSQMLLDSQPVCRKMFFYLRKCVCGWVARKPFGGGLKSGNFSRLNKSSLWGTVFPGAVWMWTQTSLHYVTTALELPGAQREALPPPAEALLAGSDAFLSAVSPPFIPLILFSTLLLAFNPALPLSFLFGAIRPL